MGCIAGGGGWTAQSMLGGGVIGTVSAIGGNAALAIAVTPTGVIGTATPDHWVVVAAPPNGCTISSVGVAPNNTVYAGGGCTAPTAAVIWRYDPAGLTWVEVQRDASAANYASLSVATDGTVFAASGAHVVVGAGTTWTSYAVAAAFVSAVTAGDAFATNGAVPTHVVHFDGTRWSPINVDPTRYYFAVAASASDLFAYGTQRISVPVPVLESFVRVP